jgi:hypothetical protein
VNVCEIESTVLCRAATHFGRQDAVSTWTTFQQLCAKFCAKPGK